MSTYGGYEMRVVIGGVEEDFIIAARTDAGRFDRQFAFRIPRGIVTECAKCSDYFDADEWDDRLIDSGGETYHRHCEPECDPHQAFINHQEDRAEARLDQAKGN
jgi:hypothetical protein